MRFTAFIAVLSLATASLGGCKFAVEHPAPFIGITAGLIAEGTCAIQVEGDQLKCVEIAGTIGVGLGAIVALAMLLGGQGDTVLQAPDDAPPEPLQEEPPDAPPTNPNAVKPVIAPAPAPDAGSAAPVPAPSTDAGSAAPVSPTP